MGNFFCPGHFFVRDYEVNVFSPFEVADDLYRMPSFLEAMDLEGFVRRALSCR